MKKREIKNLYVTIPGITYSGGKILSMSNLTAIITNDRNGKTLSINDGRTQFTFAFEIIEKYLL